ncbi:restriction endonuclease [Alicyclobacillus cycloheptanicus]|uniref:HJR/Mrr/RecB family endonuclease n=1 Tax=Alicyclobacillus cycloheptanicus TaxID=1457 RepID=A0ABT9XD86_9BACL|nr:restriction endonuclease [Alicyclobacillus cycloheptanicus]MDQ0188248.1 HJR/Mrr/RecB family endonuclease [Alicyclobacillus cycloheptanicus]
MGVILGWLVCIGLCIGLPPLGIPLLIVVIVVSAARRRQRKIKARQQEAARVDRVLKSNINEIDQMTGIQFEQYLCEVFKRSGYKVQLTSTTGDFGADLLVELKDGRKVAVQAKRYSQSVGVDAVQEVYSAVSYYGASKGVVITNNGFTKAAMQLAAKNGVILIGRKNLMAMALGERKLTAFLPAM